MQSKTMWNGKLGINLLLFGLALALVVGTQVIQGPEAQAGKPENPCTNGGIKDESAPWEATTTEGLTIISAVVKAGTESFPFTSDGSDGCYSVTGLGTCNVVVTGGGTGRDCKSISHVDFCTGPSTFPCEPEPSPTPEPSPGL